MASSSSSSKLIIDTDAGVDDAYAILLALGHTKPVDLITCCHGNCSISLVEVNVAKCCKLMKNLGLSSTPTIVSGANGPLKDGTRIEATDFHGLDGMGDVPIDDVGAIRLESTELETFKNSSVDAVSAIINMCKESENVDIIALGPLTNVANALKKGGDVLKGKLRNVYIMGGSEFLGNVTRVAEFNIYADPEAASIAFSILGSPEWSSSCKTTVLSWNLCVSHPIPWPDFDRIIYDDSNPSKIRQFLAAISKKSYPALENRIVDKKRGGKGAVICDALAMAVALNPTLILEAEKCHVEVELEGNLTRGQTVVDFAHCYDGVDRPKAIEWVTKVDTQAYIKFLETLCIRM